MANVFKRIKLPDRLPELRGWAMTAYVAIWLMLLPLAVGMPIAGSWLRYHDGAGGARMEFPLGFDDDPNWTVITVLGREAKEAGLRIGDRILAVNGVAAGKNLSGKQTEALASELRVAEGTPVRLLVSDSTGRTHTIVLHHHAATAELFYRGSGWTADSLSFTSALIPLVPWLVLLPGAILLFGRRRDPGAALFSLTFLLLTQLVGWAGLAWWHLGLPANMFGLFGVIGLFWSILAFPRGRFDPRWTAWLALLIPIDATVEATIGLPEAASNLIGAAIIAAIVTGLLVRYHREEPAERRQWRWAMLGFSFGLPLIIIVALAYGPYLRAHANDTAVSAWSWIISPGTLSIAITLMISGVLLSVLRYRIYAAQSAVSRSLVFGSLTIALLAVFAGTEKVVELIGEDYFGQSLGALAGGLGAAFAAVAIAPLHKRISRWVEQRLRKDLIFLRDRFPRQLASAADDESPEAIAGDALARTCGVLHTESGAVVGAGRVLAVRGIDEAALPDFRTAGSDDMSLSISRDDPLPVRLPLGGGAVLLLGRKPDGSLYDKDERDALAALAEPLGRALRHAARERGREVRLAGLEDQVARLTASLRSSAA
jgi:hypothetical protein